MVILRFRTAEDKKEMLKKIKKMYKFSKELLECFEDKYDDDYDDDDDEEYRHDDYEDREHYARGGSSGGRRYRRSM